MNKIIKYDAKIIQHPKFPRLKQAMEWGVQRLRLEELRLITPEFPLVVRLSDNLHEGGSATKQGVKINMQKDFSDVRDNFIEEAIFHELTHLGDLRCGNLTSKIKPPAQIYEMLGDVMREAGIPGNESHWKHFRISGWQNRKFLEVALVGNGEFVWELDPGTLLPDLQNPLVGGLFRYYDNWLDYINKPKEYKATQRASEMLAEYFNRGSAGDGLGGGAELKLDGSN